MFFIKNIKFNLLIILIFILILFNVFIYAFDKSITPTVISVADAEMRAKSIEIVNKAILDEFSKQFNYDEIIHVEKDINGNIVLLKADTLKLNKIACDVALSSQKELKELGNIGIKVPIGYILKNNILSYFGPSITIKMQPVGQIETKYISEFEQAGINQTRHKIYVQVKTKVRVIIPLKSNDIEVNNEVAVAETIIVGKIPDSALNLGLQNAGTKIDNSNKK